MRPAVRTRLSGMLAAVVLLGCSTPTVKYAGAEYSAKLFLAVCGEAMISTKRGRTALLSAGYNLKENSGVGYIGFRHAQISSSGYFHAPNSKKTNTCEIDFSLPFFDGCEKQPLAEAEVAKFKAVVGRQLGLDLDVNNGITSGIYIRRTGGGDQCITRLTATLYNS